LNSNGFVTHWRLCRHPGYSSACLLCACNEFVPHA
jgi:hypothetical protein